MSSLRRVVGAAAIATVLCVASTAQAGDIEDFQAARALYEAHDWPRAIASLELLVGGDPPRLRSQPLVLEARKYLAAAYVFVGREELAFAQFDRLLRDEPTYELDATQFPREVVQLFEYARIRLREEREAEAERARAAAQIAELRAENERLRAILTRPIEVPRSQWLVQIPFGVGQFENGDEGLGWFFGASEAVVLATMLTSVSLHTSFVAQFQDPDVVRVEANRVRINDAIRATEIVNWSSAGALGVLALAGIIQANVAFHPTRSLPARPPEIAVSFLSGPGTLDIRLDF